MKLYFAKGACSLVVRILLNEIGIESEYEAVDLKAKKTEGGEDFLKINPKGAVPTLITENNEVLTENAVILQYLADINNRNDLLPPVGNMQRYRVLEWLNYITTEIHKGFGPFFNSEIPESIKNEIYQPALKKRFNFIDRRLQKNKYLLGDDMTLPDIYLFVVSRWLPMAGLNIQEFPAVARLTENMKKRPGVQQSLVDEKLQ